MGVTNALGKLIAAWHLPVISICFPYFPNFINLHSLLFLYLLAMKKKTRKKKNLLFPSFAASLCFLFSV